VSDLIRAELQRVAQVLGGNGASFVLERPRDQGHGDLATNLAMVLAKELKQKPRDLARRVIEEIKLPSSVISKMEIAGPGFINFWLAADELSALLATILEQGAAYGRSDTGRGVRVNVEFVSANPTGPLHVGHGRGAALGDAIAALLQATGHEVVREFYINDAGTQIDKLAQSLWARVQQAVGRSAEVPEGGYHGVYLKETADQILAQEGKGFADLPEAEGIRRCRAIALITQRQEQDALLADFGVRFEVMTSEQQIYDSGKAQHALDVVAKRGLTYEQEGALWIRTSNFGDDKDRVLRKSDGSYTYLAPDIAYHLDKLERGFQRAIDVWGADHHGYVPRLRSLLKAMGAPDDFFEVALVQLVKVVRGGEEVKMSKRSGEFVTLRDLLDEVGVDAARYFFLMRQGSSPFTFDVELATRHTDENPVYYVQMAHARMSGIFRVAEREPESVSGDVSLEALPAPEDLELLKKLAVYPEVVVKAARMREPHRVTDYLEDLARLAHGWYHKCRVLGEPPPTEAARLALARAARIVLGNGLSLLGITAPDRM
jgi:arginyl-tRNA synthetase